jgi:voltage-gated potassium channel
VLTRETLVNIIRTLQRERVFALAIFVMLLVILGGFGYFLTEHPDDLSPLQRFGEGLWWAVVTITTVGYGDVVPKTSWGRVVGVAVMVGGLLSFSLVTATVASIFIERKFRRERGLETIKETNHILILGWHHDGETLLDQLLHRLPPPTRVVLVNQMPSEKMEGIRGKYTGREPLFVSGDFTREEVLLRANVRHAFKGIILGGRQEGDSAADVDQRTLITALTLKSLNPKIKILAELLRTENKPYLERAGAQQILIRGQYDSSIMAGAIASPGLYQVMDALLNAEGFTIWAIDVPLTFQGRPVKDLADYLKKQHEALLIATYSEGRSLSLEDLLGDEPSSIDEFIRSKFTETGMTHLFSRAKMAFQINPSYNLVLGPHDKAVVIAAQLPKL